MTAIVQIRGFIYAHQVDLLSMIDLHAQSDRIRNKNAFCFWPCDYVQGPRLSRGGIVFKRIVSRPWIGCFGYRQVSIMLFSFHRSIAPALIPALLSQTVVASDIKSRAETALYTLQDWYNETSGLWDTCGWWNGANVMTAVADLAMVDSSVTETAVHVFNTTFHVAPAASNPHPGPEVKTVFQRDLSSRGQNVGNASDWLDSAYDDDGWWALAWIAAYDVTKEDAYLDLAEGIFAGLVRISPGPCMTRLLTFMQKAAWGTSCDGAGIPWNPTSTYVNSITNELFLSVAAHLANRVSSEKQYYTRWAQRQWDWFSAQGFLGENNTINDGLLENCKNNGDTV